MLEYAHIALCGPRQCMNMPVLHSLAPDSAISYPESAITMVEPRAIYYQREELCRELHGARVQLQWMRSNRHED